MIATNRFRIFAAALAGLLLLLMVTAAPAQVSEEPAAPPPVPLSSDPVSTDTGITSEVLLPPPLLPPPLPPVSVFSSGSGPLFPSLRTISVESIRDQIRSQTAGSNEFAFNDMLTLRNRIRTAIEDLRPEIANARNDASFLEGASSLRARVEDARSELACAERNFTNCTAATYLDFSTNKQVPYSATELKDQLRNLEAELAQRSRFDTQLPMAEDTLSQLEILAIELENKISRALSRDIVQQNFKAEVSLYFTAIVGSMIVLFFMLLFYDPAIRASLFSSPSAIQFVTLFSIVIAVILFGITGILESRELSALLGGLSGYILGRYSNDAPAPQPAPPPAPPAAPPPPAAPAAPVAPAAPTPPTAAP